jgi:polysaccharide chain length determinant protein (PEP-CTERM system associated)
MSDVPDKPKSLGDYTHLLRRRWPYLATIIPAALLLSTLVAYLLPPLYRASGTIMLERSSLPEKMVPTIAGQLQSGDLDASQKLELLRRRVMTSQRLTDIADAIDAYPGEPNLGIKQEAARIVEDTSVEPVDPITLEPREYSTAFSIYYDNPDPRVAQDVGERLVELFVAFNKRVRAEQAEEAYRFLQGQAKELEAQMDLMETHLVGFKLKYGDALPDSQARNLAGIDRTQRDLDAIQREILAAEERESLLALQFDALSPSLTATVGDWRAELARLRGELALAEQKYTTEHPDVRRLRRAVADMATQGAASESRQTMSADNPEYLRVRSQLNSVRRELATLRASAARDRASMLEYQQNLATAPNVEREYVQLAREYQNAQNRYADVQEKMKSASLSQGLESEARGERFTLIRNVSVPKKPYWPNRMGIILLGIVLGSGLALLLAVIRDASDPTVRGSEDLEGIFDAPMGGIPVIFNQADRRRRRFLWGSVSAAYLMAVFVVVVVVTGAR